MVEGDTKETLRADVLRFLNTEEWYVGKGIPYRRGILLHGPPGCGKTSLVTALAGDLRLPIVLVPLDGDQMSDGALREVLSAAPRDSIILIEDIDCALPAREAQKQARIDPFGRRSASITLSGLLNAIDGVGSQEGRVLFMTTNHIDRLDEALIRPGRVDVTYYLGKASRAAAGELFDQFFIENGSSSTAAGTEGKFSAQVLKVARSAFLAQVEDRLYSFAALQGVLMMARDDPSLVEAGMRKLIANTAAAVDRKNESNGTVAGDDPQKEKALELQREKEAEEEQRNAGGMVLKRLIGQPGSVTNNVSERLLSFESYFPTMGSPESVTTSGIFYYELEIVEIGKPEAQFGFVLAGHLTDSTIDWNLSMGIGDDDKSWAVDGYRGQLWHNGTEAGEFDSSWDSGDVIGLAVNVEEGKIAVSKNGSWSKEGGYGVVFRSDSIPLKGVYPAFTAGPVNALRYNVAEEHFKHTAPPAEVWQNAQSEKERNNDDDAPAPATA
jgi:DNA polymerase III delta prime subunit